MSRCSTSRQDSSSIPGPATGTTLVICWSGGAPTFDRLDRKCRPGIVHRLERDSVRALIVSKGPGAPTSGRRHRAPRPSVGVTPRSCGVISQACSGHRKRRSRAIPKTAAHGPLPQRPACQRLTPPSSLAFAHAYCWPMRLGTGRTHQIRVAPRARLLPYRRRPRVHVRRSRRIDSVGAATKRNGWKRSRRSNCLARGRAAFTQPVTVHLCA